ncbi:protein of unknown function [Methylocaldum szegediense]|uniref:Uncharacterized protein n=1 Tax=Methylocaldum szegediense TaxID=73780 RepID=A0ABM9I083_9GAMM|nr:protein of unknown function [Methylocaldum szegediense]
MPWSRGAVKSARTILKIKKQDLSTLIRTFSATVGDDGVPECRLDAD